jgi:hypothetical protein
MPALRNGSILANWKIDEESAAIYALAISDACSIGAEVRIFVGTETISLDIWLLLEDIAV